MSKTATFTVSLSAATTVPVTVHWATAPGTATAPGDFVSASGTLTFAPGETVKTIAVRVEDNVGDEPTEQFTVVLSAPTNATILDGTGVCTIPGVDPSGEGEWLDRFNFTYNLLKDTANGYFGPPAGSKAFKIPYHAKEETIIIEAPDWTHESASETVSFWVKLETWKTILSGSTTGLLAAWDSIEQVWIPDSTAQPWGSYNASSPASYAPDALTLEDTPVAADLGFSVGADPLFSSLQAAYGTKNVYLMHWMIDVDGVYGFKNPDGSTTGVFINNFQRGPVEDGLATITHPSYDDWNNGGGTPYGWQPIYGRSTDLYPDGDANAYSKQMSYSMAGDADVRAVGSIHMAMLGYSGTFPTALATKASKMADYIRYTFFDKYFQAIPGFDGSGCHYLLSWGCGFGLGLPESPSPSPWGFRIGNSEIHHGYNAVDVAYAARTGGDLNPLATGSKAMWSISLDRQLEMLRWLQSPEGPIAGGVSSSWRGRYETPTDGREDAKFYGLYYTYSPSWFLPPSNNWIGYQGWGLDRVAGVYSNSAGESDSDNVSIATRCGVILDKFVAWFFDNCTVDAAGDSLSYPIVLSWVSDSPITGETASEPAPIFVGLSVNPPVPSADVYEYIPSLNWPGVSPDYATFWSGSGPVPNPNLHCAITEFGWDPGTAAGLACVLIQYCQAKKLLGGGTLSGSVPNTSITLQSVLQMAADILEVLWNRKDADGFGSDATLAYPRLDDILWVPPEFGTGHMPNGEVVANGVTTFASLRASFYETAPEWTALRAWLDSDQSGPAPSITFHRFWNGADVAVAFAMMHRFFPTTTSS